MSNNPEAIWLEPECCADVEGRCWANSPSHFQDCDDGKAPTKYVRADLAASPPPPEGLREEVATLIALNLMRWECDGDAGDWPEEKCREILAASAQAHSGDCTKQPWTCMRCEAERVNKHAAELTDAILQARER